MKVPNEPGLNPNNGLENAFLSDQSMASNPRKGQAKRFGAKLSAHGKKPGSDAVPYDFLSQFWEVLVPELLAVLQEAFEAQQGLWLAISMIQGVSTLLYSSSQKSASKHLHCCTLQHFLASPAALVS